MRRHSDHRRTAAGLILLGCVAVLAAGCGGRCDVLLSSGLIVTCGDVPPGPADPAFGEAAQILVEDEHTGDRLWIGIEDPSVFGEFQRMCASGQLSWIGGAIVIATDHSLGFFIDPDTVLVAEITAEAMQTSLAAIQANPAHFTPAGDGGLPQWVVPAVVLDVESPAGVQCRPTVSALDVDPPAGGGTVPAVGLAAE